VGKVLVGAFPLSDPANKPLVAAEGGIEALVERDQWDRPKIIPPGGGKPVSYRRASTVAEAIDDHYGLDVWKQRLLAQGLAQRPDLVQAIHTATKSELADICEAAMDQGGANVASRNGSTMHALTDRLDRGEDMPPGLPSNIVAMLEAYEEQMKRFTYLDGEQFVVQDKIKCAGTYDRRLGYEDDILIGDLKTGQNWKRIALKTAAQVAVYAAAKRYSLDGEREDHGGLRDRGVFIWLPWTEDPSDARCEVKWLDLQSGRRAIMEAFRLEDFRKIKAEQIMLDIR
jgi:hypothetical protein